MQELYMDWHWEEQEGLPWHWPMQEDIWLPQLPAQLF
jgi:hypothetical protein